MIHRRDRANLRLTNCWGSVKRWTVCIGQRGLLFSNTGTILDVRSTNKIDFPGEGTSNWSSSTFKYSLLVTGDLKGLEVLILPSLCTLV